MPLVTGPKYPEAGEILLACWNLIRASLVAGPKYVVSLPGEPGPDVDTVYPLLFRYCCNLCTSAPVEPMVRFLLKPVKVVGVELLPTSEMVFLFAVVFVVVVVVVLFVCGRTNVVLNVDSSCEILSCGITPTDINKFIIKVMSVSEIFSDCCGSDSSLLSE